MQVLDAREAAELDPTRWDHFVSQDRYGHLLQTWAWGQLKGAFGWTPYRLAVERDGELLVGAQVLYRRIGPFTLGYIPKGPVLARPDPDAVAMLWQAIRKRSRRHRAIALKVEPEWRDEEDQHHEWLRSQGFVASEEPVQPRATIIVDLCPSEDDILARMKPKWRYNIRLSMRKGVQVREGGLAPFYELMRTTGERDGFAIHSLDYYRQALALFASTDRVRLFTASYEDEPLAGLIVYAFNGRAWYMYGASSNVHRELMPNHQLQWRAMQWAKSKGCSEYDLWGITDSKASSSSAGLSGVERFKAGFGGERVRYVGAYDHVQIRPVYELMRQLWARRRAAALSVD